MDPTDGKLLLDCITVPNLEAIAVPSTFRELGDGATLVILTGSIFNDSSSVASWFVCGKPGRLSPIVAIPSVLYESIERLLNPIDSQPSDGATVNAILAVPSL
jgi:hypothetical protein